MGIGADFLENSSICGLAHIANSKTKIEKAYWIVVSVLMVAGALYLIADAFDDWAKNPISTITEPETISNVTFPQIVVCPPKVSFSFTLCQNWHERQRCSWSPFRRSRQSTRNVIVTDISFAYFAKLNPIPNSS